MKRAKYLLTSLVLLVVFLYCGVAAAVPHLQASASQAPSSFYVDLSVFNTNKRTSTYAFRIVGWRLSDSQVVSIPDGWKRSKNGKAFRAPRARRNPATVGPRDNLSGFRLLVHDFPSDIRFKLKNYRLTRAGKKVFRGTRTICFDEGPGGQPRSVPEPGTLALLGCGMLLCGLLDTRRKNGGGASH